MLIQRKVANDSTFSFNEASLSNIEKELRSLNPSKAYTFKNIPPKILKESREYCSDILQKLFNQTLSNKEFPDELKLADVTPIYKKDDPNKSKNYRSVSVLPVVSKVFEKIMHDQISQYINSYNKNIRLLGIELYKVRNNLSTHLMSEIFNLRNIDYNLRSQTDFKQGPVNTVNYGLKSLRYLAPKIWDIIPLEIRNAGSLTEFITNIKSWIPKHCPCTLCRIYIQHVGYID